MAALQVLMEYLTDTSVAPLQRDFVEMEDPFCSKVTKYNFWEKKYFDLKQLNFNSLYFFERCC